jgi:hypothetical protein
MGDARMEGWVSRLGGRIGGAALASLLATSAVPAASADAEVVLSPHRAVYDVTLLRAQGGSGISEMSGRLVYELSGNTCVGYTQTMRFVTQIVNQEGVTSISDLRMSSWEDAASRAFRFNSTQFKDRKQTEQTVGDASRADGSGRLKVALTQPSRKQLDLAPEAMFPVQHSRELVARAMKGQQLFTADLYDGSEKGDKIYATVSFIGKPRAPGDLTGLAEVESAKPLEKLVSWPMSISYYDAQAKGEDSLPAYEVAYLYYSNGVSRRLMIDYGSFAVRGTLKEIAFLDPGKCDPQAKPK